MIALGLLLLILGLLFSSVLFWIGLVLIVVGIVLHITPASSPYGRHWY